MSHVKVKKNRWLKTGKDITAVKYLPDLISPKHNIYYDLLTTIFKRDWIIITILGHQLLST